MAFSWFMADNRGGFYRPVNADAESAAHCIFPIYSGRLAPLKTAFWLKKTDPWKARGTVGLLFHLCMALFCAGVCALVCVLGTAVIATVIQKEPNLVPFMIAIMTIALGCFFSTILSWFGVVIALRHGVRIFVVSNLYVACRGDFTSAATLATGRILVNPANYIIGVSTVVPMLAIWFMAKLTTVPGHWQNQNELAPFILQGILLLLGILCIVIVVFLSTRVAARSPAECWAP